jgi:RNA polymerase sigma factor (sigma-70 family)
MGGDDLHRCATHAQRFCLEESGWLLSTCQRAFREEQFPDYMERGKDLAQDIFEKCRRISDEKWSTINNKKAYLSTTIYHDVCESHRQDREVPTEAGELADSVRAYTPVEGVFAAIYVGELLQDLSSEEQQLVDCLYEGLSGEETASRLGISHDAARKRLQHLREKIALRAAPSSCRSRLKSPK